jgi:hypothetical protein
LSRIPSTSRTPRNAASDRELQALLVLELAETEAGESGFAAHALSRLSVDGDRQPRALHDLHRIVNELAVSAADLGSWGALSLQALDHAGDIPRRHREFIESALRASIVLGAITYRALVLARDHLPAEIDR